VSDHDPQVARFRSKASLSVADVTVAEGDKGTTPATFTVQLSRPLSQPTQICAATLGLTASEPSDYAGLGECRTLAAGTTSTTFVVSVRGDTKKEADEQFALLVLAGPYVRLAKPVGVATITNDD
jgi:uncharacterized protein